MRIAGINIPSEKKIGYSLRYVYGLGPTNSKKILDKAGIDENIRTKALTREQEDKIRLIAEKEYVTEGDLRREVGANIKRMKDNGSYRGSRHMKHLPARGQRTKTNSRTVRGNTRKTVGSGRKPSGLKT